MNSESERNENFAHAMSNLMRGNLGMSIDLLNEIVDADPADKLALLARGAVYMKRGDTDRSVADFGRVIDLDEGYAKAEVTAGGVDLAEVDRRTLESRRAPGLHFAGEVLDATGRLGGFNFQWAWSSGAVAGRAAAAACRKA